MSDGQAKSIDVSIRDIVITLTTAAVISMASFAWSSAQDKTMLVTKLEFLTKQVSKLETKLDELNNNYATKADLKDLDNRVRILEKKS